MSDTAETQGDGNRAWRRLAISTAAGVAAPIVMAVAGVASPLAAVLAAVAVGAVGLVVAVYSRTRRPPDPPPPADSPRPTGPFAAVLEQLPDPLLLIEGGARDEPTSRRFLFANVAARDLLRIQRPNGLLATAIRAPDVLDAVEEALYERQPGHAVYELRGVQDRVWRARALPLTHAGTTGRLAVLWLRDETEIRRIERTRADFLANASHELRTPLASLSGFIDTLRGHAREDAAARERFLTIMHGQAERMRRLIDDLMSLSRIELGEHIPPAGIVDLGLLAPDVLDALAPLAAERCVTFESDLPAPGVALAVADRDQIMQVLQNLAENAAKYTARGATVKVQVIAGLGLTAAATPVAGLSAYFSLLTPEHALGRNYVAVRVRDFGAGIARSHLPRLTERFYRVEGQKARERPGTGLGLAIVKHIVNRHRGGLLVESEPGEGSMFTAYFPMAPALQPAEPPTGLTG
ncbi:MAG TPA: ATP-binding protein [Caulobacteraceae bacterium]|jgi:two-component system phosphate regulon sensor histidine kinase PhoR|nr:ATP-binding protein [Caulobacteraceae bacterium]